jgi:hypothetical protein
MSDITILSRLALAQQKVAPEAIDDLTVPLKFAGLMRSRRVEERTPLPCAQDCLIDLTKSDAGFSG